MCSSSVFCAVAFSLRCLYHWLFISMTEIPSKDTRHRRDAASRFLHKVADAAQSDAIDFDCALGLVEVLDEGWIVLTTAEVEKLFND